MQVLILIPYRKDNIYFRTIEEREKINEFLFRSVFLLSIIGSSSQSFFHAYFVFNCPVVGLDV